MQNGRIEPVLVINLVRNSINKETFITTMVVFIFNVHDHVNT